MLNGNRKGFTMEDTKRTGVEIPDAVLKAAVELLERTRLSLEDDMALTRFELRAGDPGPPSQRFVSVVDLFFRMKAVAIATYDAAHRCRALQVLDDRGTHDLKAWR